MALSNSSSDLTTDQILTISHHLQPWRPDQTTLEFIAEFNGIMPFCPSCADWHHDNEECSAID